MDLDILESVGLARLSVEQGHNFESCVKGVEDGLNERGYDNITKVLIPENNTCYFCWGSSENA